MFDEGSFHNTPRNLRRLFYVGPVKLSQLLTIYAQAVGAF